MNILAVILVFGLLVSIHEVGHYLFAKREGFKVSRFSIGLGPAIYKTKKNETVFSVGIIPFGGYCNVEGLFEEETGFVVGSPISRLKVVLGGSLMNYFLSFILFSLILISGDPLNPTTTISGFVDGMPAQKAGLLVGDTIKSINGKEVSSWKELVRIVNDNPDKELVFLIERKGYEFEVTITPKLDSVRQVGLIGVYPQFKKSNPLSAIYLGFIRTASASISIVSAVLSYITKGTSLELMGPVGVAQVVSRAYGAGILYLMFITALLSANLATINLFPFPALDGGHIITFLYEFITKRRPNIKVLGYINFIGFVLLMTLISVISLRELFNILFK